MHKNDCQTQLYEPSFESFLQVVHVRCMQVKAVVLVCGWDVRHARNLAACKKHSKWRLVAILQARFHRGPCVCVAEQTSGWKMRNADSEQLRTQQNDSGKNVLTL